MIFHALGLGGALWKALRGSGIPPFLLHLLQDLHTGTTARIRTQYGISEIFHTTSGVRQDCILAPALFCCAIDWLMKHCNSNFGIDVGSAHFTDIDYADDAVLFTADPNNWAHVLHINLDSTLHGGCVLAEPSESTSEPK